MTEEEYHKDRRVDIADVKIATLEERSLATAATQARIEKKLDEHIVAQQIWQEAHGAEEASNWAKIEAALAVITSEVSKNKEFIKRVTLLLGAAWALIVLYKDQLLDFFFKK